MTTITPFAAGSYVSSRNTSQLLGLKNQLNGLSTQLSTGLVAQTYGGLGTGRSTALAAQSTLSALNGYASGITAGQTRTNLAVTSLTQVATMGTSTLATLNNGLQSAPINSTASQSIAMSNLNAALDTLNQSAAGAYLFGGSNSTTQPVLDANTILNGTKNNDGTIKQAGLKDFIAQQTTADLGVAGYGRLISTAPGEIKPSGSTLGSNQISISEDPSPTTRANFGFLISSPPTTTGNAIKVNYPAPAAGDPNSFTLTVSSQPSAGDAVTFALKTHDGLTTTLTLTAKSAGQNSDTSFLIGDSADATAANLSSAINSALNNAAKSTLSVSSTERAAQNFFTGSASKGVVPQQISSNSQGDPIYVPGTANNTILWYQGEDGDLAARSSQSVQISSTGSIGVGVRANEPAIQNVLAGLATVAFSLPSSPSTDVGATYQAVLSGASKLLSSASNSPSVQDIVTELSNGSAQLSNASARNTATQNTLQNTLDGIEQAPTEEVITKLLDVQNRLQASYQLTSSLSKLSLVNYIN